MAHRQPLAWLAVPLLLAVLVAAPSALAHQTASGGGVTVTMHLAPDDEPVAGEQSSINVTKVTPNKGTFKWRNCACRVKVTDSSGSVIMNRPTGAKRPITFPREGAYSIRFSGRYKRNGTFKPFAVAFAVRAS